MRWTTYLKLHTHWASLQRRQSRLSPKWGHSRTLWRVWVTRRFVSLLGSQPQSRPSALIVESERVYCPGAKRIQPEHTVRVLFARLGLPQDAAAFELWPMCLDGDTSCDRWHSVLKTCPKKFSLFLYFPRSVIIMYVSRRKELLEGILSALMMVGLLFGMACL